MTCPEHAAATEIVARALAEDLADAGDVTTAALIDPDRLARASIGAVHPGVLAGVVAATEVFTQVDSSLEQRWSRKEGAWLDDGDVFVLLKGHLRSILTAERTALNLLGHLSGVATLTRRFVEAAGPDVTILDTRKTTPGLRILEKAAVRSGGGANHRMGLFDAVLIKDNHLAHVPIAHAVARARHHAPGMVVEVECDTLEQVAEAVDAGADRVLLDNMTPDEVKESVAVVDHRAHVEVSGGIALDNVAAYAAAGPDSISVGAITHSAPALDVSMVVVS